MIIILLIPYQSLLNQETRMIANFCLRYQCLRHLNTHYILNLIHRTWKMPNGSSQNLMQNKGCKGWDKVKGSDPYVPAPHIFDLVFHLRSVKYAKTNDLSARPHYFTPIIFNWL